MHLNGLDVNKRLQDEPVRGSDGCQKKGTQVNVLPLGITLKTASTNMRHNLG